MNWATPACLRTTLTNAVIRACAPRDVSWPTHARFGRACLQPTCNPNPPNLWGGFDASNMASALPRPLLGDMPPNMFHCHPRRFIVAFEFMLIAAMVICTVAGSLASSRVAWVSEPWKPMAAAGQLMCVPSALLVQSAVGGGDACNGRQGPVLQISGIH